MTDIDPFPFGKLADDAPTPRVIVHVGAPKCGSSSLQTALAARPEFRNSYGAALSYLCASARSARTGNAVRMLAAASPYGYDSSSDIRDAEEAAALSRRIETAVGPIVGKGAIPILSCEGWSRRAPLFQQTGLFEKIGGGVHVVLFVRPPLDWLNAAWWQWGAWTAAELDQYLRRAVPFVRWPKLAKQWADIPGVDAVHVRLADTDVVQTFFDLIEADRPVTRNINTGLPPALQAFLLRNRDLRPGSHEAGIEFLLSRALAGAPPPPVTPPLWAMTPAQSSAVWQDLRFHPRRLAPLLPPEDRVRLRDQPKWFNADPYQDRHPTGLDDLARPEVLRDLRAWLEVANGSSATRPAMNDLAESDAAIRAQVMALVKGSRNAMSMMRSRFSDRG